MPRPRISDPNGLKPHPERAKGRTQRPQPRAKEDSRNARLYEIRKWCMEYRIQGMTLRDIQGTLQDEHGISRALPTIAADIAHMLRERYDEMIAVADQLRGVEEARLEKMLTPLWPLIHQGDCTAISTALRVMKRKAEMMGLDQPIQSVMKLEGGDHPLQVESVIPWDRIPLTAKRAVLDALRQQEMEDDRVADTTDVLP